MKKSEIEKLERKFFRLALEANLSYPLAKNKVDSARLRGEFHAFRKCHLMIKEILK